MKSLALPGRAPRWRRLGTLLTVGAVLMAGCGDDDKSPAEPGEPDLEFGQVIFTAPGGDDILWSHGDHWHGALRVTRGDTLEMEVSFVHEFNESHEAPPEADRFTLDAHSEYTLHLRMEDATIASWDGDAATGTLVGRFVGSTGVIVEVRRAGRKVWSAPTVPLRVYE